MISVLVYISQSPVVVEMMVLGVYLGVIICDMGSRKTLLDRMVVGVGVLEKNHLNYSF